MPAPHEVLLGPNAVLEQLRADASRIRRILVGAAGGSGARRVGDEARRHGVTVVPSEARDLARIAGGARHQGVVAEVEEYRYADWHDLLASKLACIVALDEVTDPRNLGAVARSVDAAGAGAMVVPKHRAAGVTAVAVRAAAGATARVPIARVTNLANALREATEHGYWVVGLDGDAPVSLFEFSFPERVILVFGAEGRGIRPLVRKVCDHLVAIPMRGAVGSLNVSAAAAITLFERLRRNGAVDTPGGR